MAILLVLLRHADLFAFTTYIGWIGVDLFFVLSGFLVAGLLFKEYKKYGSIQPLRFLIRRGFKIYPIYYLSYPVYLYFLVIGDNVQVLPILADLCFIQNYVSGWGFAYGPSWSLAVEEHFYFGIAIFFWLYLRNHVLGADESTQRSGFTKGVVIVLCVVLALRIISNEVFPDLQVENFTMTHLRIDALLAGVYVAYLFHFRYDSFKRIFEKVKKYLWLIALVLLAGTLAMGDTEQWFVRTFGISALYCGFSIFLVYVLLSDNINQKLNQLFTRVGVDVVSKIGLYSYSIYVIHTAINNCLHTNKLKNLLAHVPINQHYLPALLGIIISVAVGMLMTFYVENWFLKIRNRYFPARSE